MNVRRGDVRPQRLARDGRRVAMEKRQQFFEHRRHASRTLDVLEQVPAGGSDINDHGRLARELVKP